MADSQAVNEGSKADRLAAIRRRVKNTWDLAYRGDWVFLLDRLAEAEARAEKAECERDESVRRTGYRPTDEQFDAFFDALAELIYSDEHTHMDAGMAAVRRDWTES